MMVEGLSLVGGGKKRLRKQRSADHAKERVSESCHSMFFPLPVERIGCDYFRIGAVHMCDATGGHVRGE